MDYEQKYKEALERAKGVIEQNPLMEYLKKGIEYILPELKENEDERIRKGIIRNLEYLADRAEGFVKDELKERIAWLEKQGEQKPVKNIVQIWKDMRFEIHMQASGDDMTRMFSLNDIDEIVKKISEQKLADKVEPKFHEGDWVIDKQSIVHQISNVIENVTNHTYGYDIVGGGYFNDNTEGVRLWTIQDAKDGDVLVASDDSIFIFKGTIDCACKHYVALTTDGVVKFNKELKHYWETSRAVHPATKEQRDLLFQKMHEAGYEWDAEKKELKEIEHKPAWSEEDEEIHRTCICTMRASACGFPEEEKFVEQVDNWLKSLKERYTWKPSDEQMDALNYVVNLMASSERPTENDLYYNILKSLRQQLKKHYL